MNELNRIRNSPGVPNSALILMSIGMAATLATSIIALITLDTQSAVIAFFAFTTISLALTNLRQSNINKKILEELENLDKLKV